MTDLALILRAAAFAADKHRTQRRKDADASADINHPIGLARVLAAEAGIEDPIAISAALLHDTIEDTQTTTAELESEFGAEIRAVVEEVTDDKRLLKSERKRLQIEHADSLSPRARLVKLADKICNLRDLSTAPPVGWSIERKREYFDWAKAVIDRIRGTHPTLESLFDEAYRRRP